jgi:AcrR family transcriptional regulator
MVQKRTKDAQAEPKRRGRPRAYDPGEALARAAATFWKAGYAGTSLDDLVEATGMNRPSLYAAFGDKREIYLKTLDYYMEESRALARAALAGDPPLRVFLKRFYDKALDLYFGDGPRGCYTVGTAATVAAVDDDVRKFLADRVRNADDFLRRQIEKAQARRDRARCRSGRACVSGNRHAAHARHPLARRHAAQGTRRAGESGDRGDLRETSLIVRPGA